MNLIGRSFGRYQIVEQLGEGGMATVYKGFDPHTERFVAVKFIMANRAGSEKILKRFEREARSLAQLFHPNIVRITDYGEQDGIPYLVMDYLKGGTLKQQMGEAVYWAEAARTLLPIARALGYAHQHGIIHRDVKPANILITDSGEPMLSDFGIAKILTDDETAELTAAGVGIGTPEYMSPEQAKGLVVDARSDVYALGIVYYEMVTGRKPYRADTPLAVAIKQATEPLPSPKKIVPSLPDKVEQVLLKALAKQPEHRYQSMNEFSQALEQLAFEGFAKNKTGPVIAVVKPTRKVVIPLAVISALLVGAVVLYALLNGAKPPSTDLANQLVGQTVVAPVEATGTTVVEQAAEANHEATASLPIPSKKDPVNSTLVRTGKAVYWDDFDAVELPGWEKTGNVVVEDGLLKVAGEDGGTLLNRRGAIKKAGSIAFRFRASKNANFVLALASGSPNSASYFQWGVEKLLTGQFTPAVSEGNQVINQIDEDGSINIKEGKWYHAWFSTNEKEYVILVWEDGNLNQYYEFRKQMPPYWNFKLWQASIQTAEGWVEIDRYEELDTVATTGRFLRLGLVDDFNDQKSNERLDSEEWDKSGFSKECLVSVQENSVTFEFSEPPVEEVHCPLPVDRASSVRLNSLRNFEAKLKISSDHNQKDIGVGVDIGSSSISGGSWWSFCGLKASENTGVAAVFDMTNWGKGLPADINADQGGLKYDQWYTLRQVIDPESGTFSCYLDGKLLGSVTPPYVEDLKEARFHQNVDTYRVEGATTTTYIDDVRLLP